MTSDDNHDDDAQLRQLRAVWVSMRDEDPPDRGLAALMTAARTKAAELEQAAAPSWWQRVAATLRRPPVLALASVTLLLGGALIVTQRSSQMKAETTVETESQTKGGGEGPMATAPAAGSATVVQPRADENFMEHDLAKPAEVAVPPPPPPPEPPKLRDTKPASKSVGQKAKRPTSDSTGAMESTAEGGPRGAGAGAPALVIAQDDAPVMSAPTSRDDAETLKVAPKKPIGRTAPPAIDGEDRVVSKDAAKPSLDQLVKQCESAAARGDCAAVRTIAQKILTTAPAAYKSRVASNAAINRCLPDTAANTAAD